MENTKNMEERVLYGYMDGDYLQCIEIAPIPQKIRNEKTGEITTRMVSVIEQVAELPTIYKPVDAIDESKQNTDMEGYAVRIVTIRCRGQDFIQIHRSP